MATLDELLKGIQIGQAIGAPLAEAARFRRAKKERDEEREYQQGLNLNKLKQEYAMKVAQGEAAPGILDISQFTPASGERPASLSALPVSAEEVAGTKQAPTMIAPGMFTPPDAPAIVKQFRDKKIEEALSGKRKELELANELGTKGAVDKATALEPFNIRDDQRKADAQRGMADVSFTNRLQELQKQADLARETGRLDDERGLQNEIAKMQEQARLMPNPSTAAKPPTEAQAAYQVYGNRMDQSNKDLEALSNFVPNEAGDYLPNRWKSTDRQKFEQAENNFINAVLRRESGATISDQERANARKQYIRQPGDSPEVIAQKKANREAVIYDFKRLGGGSAAQSQGGENDPLGVL
jgi:hypothetical protein